MTILGTYVKISVCTPLNLENISSRRNSFGLGSHISHQNEHISVKKMKLMAHVQSCQLFLEYCACCSGISLTSTSTPTFIVSVNSVFVIKKRARNICKQS